MSLSLIDPTYLPWPTYNAILDQELGSIPQVKEEDWTVAAEECFRKLNTAPSPFRFQNWRQWAKQLSFGE